MFAQLQDNFADGDFTQAPHWAGTDSKFIVTDEHLKLQADPVPGVAYLATTSSAIQPASWEFRVKLEFNPSSANFARIYLVSNQQTLTGPLNGYYVLLGNSSDEVSLYKQTGTLHTKIIDGEDKLLDRASVELMVRVVHSESGLWELFTDIDAGGMYLSQGTISDSTHTEARYFGVYCAYSATRSDKFYFDDFAVAGNPLNEESVTELSKVETISDRELSLAFSGILDQHTAEEVMHYRGDNLLGYPLRATLQPDKMTIFLYFETPFSEGLFYTLHIEGMKDGNGNIIPGLNGTFTYFQSLPASPMDIIFTEVFADPSPQVGLPEVEFAEIYNRSNKAIDLQGWQLGDPQTAMTLPQFILLPGEYLTLSPSLTEFALYGKTWGSPDFPSLNNMGDVLLLSDGNGTTIDSLNYDDSWYRESAKKDGGWSLELIDPENLCSEKENWKASEDPQGGTPGRQNSVFANKPDLTGPALLTAMPLSPTTVKLTFNEKLHETLPTPEAFHIDSGIEIDQVSFGDPSLTSLVLTLHNNLRPGVIYSLTTALIYDCAGNPLRDLADNVFGLPEIPLTGDIVINEILFNPRPLGVDFVEIVNTSSKFINLRGYFISNVEDNLPRNPRLITSEDILFVPGAYLVLTEDSGILKAGYPLLHERNALNVSALPALNDDEGSVACVTDQQAVLDQFHYTSDFHSVFIKNDEGVSLERIDMKGTSNDPQNWKSASPLAGFATPGYLNSNARDGQSWPMESITVEPEAFSPLVGSPDFTQIHFKFDQGGYVGNVKIFDERGHLIKRVANNEILGAEGILRWDGDQDDGNKARIGYYMVWVEVFDAVGNVKTFRNRVVIAGPD